jgi:hypothetical protein
MRLSCQQPITGDSALSLGMVAGFKAVTNQTPCRMALQGTLLGSGNAWPVALSRGRGNRIFAAYSRTS